MAKAPSATPADPAPIPVTYRSTAPVYLGTLYYEPGQKFTTANPPLDEWTEVGAAAAAAPAPADAPVNLDDMDIPALKAYAAGQGIDLGDAESEPDMVAKIRAVLDAGK